jgi:hypothetical protein
VPVRVEMTQEDKKEAVLIILREVLEIISTLPVLPDLCLEARDKKVRDGEGGVRRGSVGVGGGLRKGEIGRVEVGESGGGGGGGGRKKIACRSRTEKVQFLEQVRVAETVGERKAPLQVNRRIVG